MADNLTTTTTVSTVPASTVISTDEVGGAHVQRVKLACGPDGTATDVPVGGGVEAAALRVTLPTDGTGVVSAALLGAVTETAPATDTASSGLNGRLQRIAQRLTSLIALFKAEDAASADGDVGVGMLAVRKATPANTSGTDGDYEFVQMSAGRVWVSSDVTAVVPGTGATNLGKAEDAAHSSGDVGVMALAVRSNAAASTSGADGDYQPLITDTNGRLHVVNSAGMAGDVAHDGADTGNPVKVGFQARTTNPAVVADADRVNAIADKQGRQIVQPFAPRDLVVIQHTQIVNSSAETTIVTAGASGVFHDLVALIITLQTATACTVTIKDATGGTTRLILQLAATVGDVKGATFTVPLPQASAANNWTATLSSNAVTVNIFAQAVKTL